MIGLFVLTILLGQCRDNVLGHSMKERDRVGKLLGDLILTSLLCVRIRSVPHAPQDLCDEG